MILTFVPSRNDFILATIRIAIHPNIFHENSDRLTEVNRS